MRLQSDRNVTPMIDVLLVLLVIFMAALPLSQRGLDVTLPPEVQPATVEGRLKEIYESRRDKTLFVMRSGTLRYGEIITVIDAARGAGVGRVGVMTERMRRR